MSPRVVILCGHESPYGIAHLLPLLESRLRVGAIVIADSERWRKFRQALTGKLHLRSVALTARERFKVWGRGYLPESVLRRLQSAPKPLDIYRIAADHRIPLWIVNDVNAPDFVTRLKSLEPDYLISAAYPQIFRTALLNVPKHGCINFHPSLLPQFRGAHPHFWAIATGAEETGVTAHFMTEDLDAGDIISRRTIPIDECYYSELYARIIQHTPEIVYDVERFLVDGSGKPEPQNSELATTYREPRDVHKRIFWSLHTADQIMNLIRTEQAFCYFYRHRVRIMRAYLPQGNRNLNQ
ncbi:hypothetical protein HC928_05220 [bacterium]|nr:hypothetical protein [bacterium]